MCVCVCVVDCQLQWSDLRSMQVTTVAAFTHSITIYGHQSTTQISFRLQACFVSSLCSPSYKLFPRSLSDSLSLLSLSFHFLLFFFFFTFSLIPAAFFSFFFSFFTSVLPFLSILSSSVSPQLPILCPPSIYYSSLLFSSLLFSSLLPIIALLSFICHSSPLCSPSSRYSPPVCQSSSLLFFFFPSLISHGNSYPLISPPPLFLTPPLPLLPLNHFITPGFLKALS